MTTFFALCAVVGGTVLVFQFVMTLVGLGHELDGGVDHDLPHDLAHDAGLGDHGGDAAAGPSHAGGEPGHVADAAHGTNWLFAVVSFRTVVAALTFFGLGGLAALSARQPAPVALGLALVAGGAAMYGVYWLMQGLSRLRSDGTERLNRAVGHLGTVYLKIPGQRAGTGKIHLNLQNRTVECLAMTAGAPLATGTNVVVTDVLGPETVLVELAATPH